jgi:hypothetical protein
MVSEALAGHPSFVQGEANARRFALGTTLAERQAAVAALSLAGEALKVANRVVDCEDWGPRVVGLQAAATFHANNGEGAMAAAIASVVCDLFAAASETAPPEIRTLARSAIASASTDFAYGAQRAGALEDAIGLTVEQAPRLRVWGFEDAARTIETIGAECLADGGRLDEARTKLPAKPPSDIAGNLLWDRVHQRLFPQMGTEPTLADRYQASLKAMESMLALLRANPGWASAAAKAERELQRERQQKMPSSDDEWLERIEALRSTVRGLMALTSGGSWNE